MADAGFRLVVEGEKEFREAIKNINSVLAVNRSELKMLAEQYKISTAPMNELRDKQASLSDAMELQREKSAKIAEQIEKVSAVYGDQDERVKTLVKSYNESETELAKLQSEYQKTSEVISDAEDAMRALSAAQTSAVGTAEKTADAADELGGAIDQAAKSADSGSEKTEALSRSLDAGTKAAGSNKDKIAELDKEYESLTASMEKQRGNIETLKSGLEKVEKAYGANSGEAAAYRKQIDEASAALDDMSRSAADNRQQLDTLQKDDGGFAGMTEAIKKLDGVLGTDLSKTLESITGNLSGMKDMISDMVNPASLASGALVGYAKAVIGSIGETAESMSELKDSAAELGLSAGEYQKLEFALEQVGVSAEGLSEIFNPLYSKMSETHKLTGKYIGRMDELRYASEDERKSVIDAMNTWSEYGVALYDTEGKLRDVNEIFFDLIDVYAQYTNQSERMAKMQEIFGETASKVNKLVEVGADNLREYAQIAEDTGAVIDDAMVNSMDNLNTRMVSFKSNWEKVKEGLALSWMALLQGDWKSVQSASEYGAAALKRMFTGKAYAGGTRYADGGLALVGENGPEIVSLPRGSEVFPHGITPAMLNGGAVSNVYNITISADDVRQFNDIIRIAESRRQDMRMGRAR